MMVVDGTYVSCPKCGWEPNESDIWVCDVCRTRWNTFETHGKCPGCGKQFIDTECSRSRGGCGQMSLNAGWYKPIELLLSKNKRFAWFWQKKDDLPVTAPDRVWLEANLASLVNLLGSKAILLGRTITPNEEYFQYKFSGTEKDLNYLFKTLPKIIGMPVPDVKLMLFSQEPADFGEGVTATPSETLANNWHPAENDLIKNEQEEFEVWVDTEYLKNTVALIASLARLLSRYLLMTKYEVSQQLKTRADLASIVLGFGIFRANAYFNFNQWIGVSHLGWNMSKESGSSEQRIAYVLAWLAHYRKEDIAWKSYLNKTVENYFDKSYTYIGNHLDTTIWPS